MIEQAAVTVAMSDLGISATGTFQIKPPGANSLILMTVQRTEKGDLLFTGDGIIDIQGLKPLKLDLTYSKDGLFAQGKAPFELFGKASELTIAYEKDAFSGSVDEFKFKKGRATVTLHKLALKKGKFTGSGEISMPLGKKFVATGTVSLDEKQKLAISAALKIANPIVLFDAFGDTYQILKVGVSIPIPGASIGGIGLEARIEGSIDAGYKIGPGTLEEAELAAGVDPLQEGGPTVSLKARLTLPAKATITGSISGSVALDILVAEVSGGIKLTASAQLSALSSIDALVVYTPQRLMVDGKLDAAMKLLIGVALDAFVRAKAGLSDYFSVTTEKVWKLGRWSFDPGVSLSMTAQIHYEDDKPFQMPTIVFNKPSIDRDKLLKGTFDTAGPTAKEGKVK